MMEKIYDFPERETVKQEAAEWLIRLDSEELLSQRELQALRAWIHRSPLHKEELVSLAEFWSNQSLVALPISLEELCYEEEANHNIKLGSWGKQPLWLTTAALVLCVSATLLFNSHWLSGQPEIETELFATAVGQQRMVTLSDGTRIELNTNSQIQIEYNDRERNVFLLQGEAHFDVARQTHRPFKVYAGRGLVQALGTAFTVYFKDSSDIDVMVTEGKVSLGVLSNETETVEASRQAEPSSNTGIKPPEYYVTIPVEKLGILEAGQATTILVAKEVREQKDKLDTVENITRTEQERRGAWRSGVLVFSGDSLEEVVRQLSRYTTLSIEIVDPELKKIRIGGRFSVESTSALFNALEANFGLHITQLDYNRVQISAANTNYNN